jgi:hypothetical protein
MRKKKAKSIYSSVFTQHKDFVLKHRRTFNDMLLAEESEQSSNKPGRAADTQEALLSEVVETAIRLEAVSRKLLIDSMPRGSLGRSILEADRNIQLRDVHYAGGDAARIRDLWQQEDDQNKRETESLRSGQDLTPEISSTLSEIRRYRDLFAHLLVAASTLRQLDGIERHQFERWLADEENEDDCRDPSHESAEARLVKPPNEVDLVKEKLQSRLTPAERKEEKKRLEKEYSAMREPSAE